jgi:hypothetical protein
LTLAGREKQKAPGKVLSQLAREKKPWKNALAMCCSHFYLGNKLSRRVVAKFLLAISSRRLLLSNFFWQKALAGCCVCLGVVFECTPIPTFSESVGFDRITWHKNKTPLCKKGAF